MYQWGFNWTCEAENLPLFSSFLDLHEVTAAKQPSSEDRDCFSCFCFFNRSHLTMLVEFV